MDPKSPLLEEPKQQEDPQYTADEIQYVGALQRRLEEMRDQRNQRYDEFDGMTYVQYWESNEKGANTYIAPKKNPEDTTYASGTIRYKLFSIVADLLGLDLTPDIRAFDENDIEINSLGHGMEDIFEKCEQLDNDEEKKFLRQYELLKQGDVFVEEIWDERYEKSKVLDDKKKFDGTVKGVTWMTRMKRVFCGPTRTIVSGLSVLLGNIRVYLIGDQPDLATVAYMDYSKAQAIYGKWERWKFVPKDLKQVTPDMAGAANYNNWRLDAAVKGKVEVIKYQNKPANEYALMLNGVLMTPVGLPFPWGFNEYSITQQHLKPIHANFAYGSSFVKEIRNNVGIMDELSRALILKVWQSVKPPLLNNTGRIVSRRVLMPSVITPGIQKGQLTTVLDKVSEGVTPGELGMYKEISEQIDKDSVNPINAGQNPDGSPTATEVLQVSMAAKKMAGVIVLSAALLEQKLAWLRLFTVLQNWFDPVDEVVDTARNALKQKYRSVSVDRAFEGSGRGRRVVRVVDKSRSAEDVYREEEQLTASTGQPYRIIEINPQEISLAKLIWNVVVRPRQKTTNELSKLMFSRFLADARENFPNDMVMPYFEEQFAERWDVDPRKAFKTGINAPPPEPSKPTAGGISLPTPEKGVSQALNNVAAQ